MQEHTYNIWTEDGSDIGSVLGHRWYEVWFRGEKDHLAENPNQETEKRAAAGCQHQNIIESGAETDSI